VTYIHGNLRSNNRRFFVFPKTDDQICRESPVSPWGCATMGTRVQSVSRSRTRSPRSDSAEAGMRYRQPWPAWESKDMANVALKNAREVALSLPEQDRAQLVHELLASLDGPEDADASAAWGAEVASRLADVEQGKVVLVDADDVVERVRAKVHDTR
jgi:putative addiction module component (TIGR02574 family)